MVQLPAICFNRLRSIWKYPFINLKKLYEKTGLTSFCYDGFCFLFTCTGTTSPGNKYRSDHGYKPPNPNDAQLMRAEEANHPNIVNAMHDIEKSMHSLHNAPDDFGGRKALAESDLKQAWISLRKALYFRLYQDTH